MPDFDLLFALLSSIDGRQINLLRLYELQIDFLRSRVQGRLLPNECEKAALAHLASEIGRPDLSDRNLLFHPETLFRWHRELVAAKFDGSDKRGPGRPSPWRILSSTILRMASDNPSWGSLRIHGQLMSLGYSISEPSVRRLMRRLGLVPNPKPGKRWSDFLERNKGGIVATDFFTYEAWTPKGPRTLYALFFIQHDTRRVHVAGITEHPDEAWMTQIARNLTMEGEMFLKGRKFLIMDRDTKYCQSFRDILKDSGLNCLRLPWRSPDLNAVAERWVRTVKEECLNHLILPGPESLMKVLNEYLGHFHHERTHQGLGNKIPFPINISPVIPKASNQLQRRSRMGGLLNYYYWDEENPEKRAA